MTTLTRHDRAPSNLLKNVLAQKQKVMKAKGRKLRLKRTPKQRPPLQQQREYFRALKVMTDDLYDLTLAAFTPARITSILRSAHALRPDAKGPMLEFQARSDDFLDDVDDIVNGIKDSFYTKWPDEKVQEMAGKAAKQTNKFSKDQFSKTGEKVTGVDPITGDPWLAQEVRAFTVQNVNLIKSIPEEHFKKLQDAVIRGATSGTLQTDITDTIKKIGDVSENKAKLIARDQVSKFNGNLSKLRQKDVGLKRYIWSTSGDDRVRPDHAERDGKTFSWDDPPEDGHPGEPINCRCVAIPVFEDVLETESEE